MISEKGQPFEGIKVVEFSWFGVGPRTIKFLAEYGAEIIKVESVSRPDLGRTVAPYANNITGVNRSFMWARYNNSKLGMSLNLKQPKGLEIAKRLIAWADIVTDAFTPGTMQRLGLSYEEVKKIKPNIIMASTCMQGQTGPGATSPGVGVTMTSLSGFNYITGWPDRPPPGIPGAYTDFIVPSVFATALLAALDYRERTGKGQYLDLSQLEASLHYLAPIFLDYQVNNRIFSRNGNRLGYAAPHGIYRCKGEDRWCAIAVFTDEEWKNFCNVIGNPSWTQESRFSILLERVNHADELDKFVGEWTINHSAEEVMFLMQTAGVAAGVVETGEDVWNDPQLQYLNALVEVEHPDMGKCFCEREGVELSKSYYKVGCPALIGEHTQYICEKILGMSDEEFVTLLSEGIFN